jgi:mannose-6-phosphate isomerase-like protein (cupin superfamily)
MNMTNVIVLMENLLRVYIPAVQWYSMKFTKDSAKKFKFKGIEGYEYISKEDFPEMSCAYITVTGTHGKIKNVKSNRVYFVIDGKGEFTVNDEKVKVRTGDVVVIPKGTPYDYSGHMKLLLVDSPAFDPGADVKLE